MSLDEMLMNYVNLQTYELPITALRDALLELSTDQRAQIIGKTVSIVGNTPISVAVLKNHSQILQHLLDSLDKKSIFGLLTTLCSKGESALHFAARKGNVEIMDFMLDAVLPEYKQALMKVTNGTGHIALHYAIMHGHKEMVKCILNVLTESERLELLKVQSVTGNTAIHHAALLNHAEIMDCLLNTISSEDEKYKLLCIRGGESSLSIDFAAKHTLPNAIRCMVDSVPPDMMYDLMKKTRHGGNPALHYAALAGSTKSLQCMLEKLTADQRYELLTMPGQLGVTVMHTAARGGHFEAIRCMVESVPPEKQMDLIQARNINNQMPLEIVSRKNSLETADLITRWMSLVEERSKKREGISVSNQCVYTRPPKSKTF